MKYLFTLVLFLFAVLTCSCSKSDPESDSQEDNPLKCLSLSQQEMSFVKQGNNFALRFFDEISDRHEESVVVSPLSMQFLLGMALDGAQGETADQISTVLGYGANQTDAVNQYCLSVMKQLPGLDKKTNLAFANAAYANKNNQFLEAFKNSVGQYYEADVSNMDFSDKSTLSKINSWCSKHTKSLIPSIVDNLSGAELAVLLNATYFKSEWKQPFDKINTSERSFTCADGKSVNVSMMAQTGNMIYMENEDLRLVSLPYGNEAYSMLVILPANGKTLADVTETLKNKDLNSVLSSWGLYEVDLWLPKFETKFNIELNDVLSEMGMPDSFNPDKANFLSMFKSPSHLSLVKQNSFIKVEERGTEAASVSKGKVVPTAAGPSERKAVFHADHPFVYLITENSSNIVLFAGKYTGE